MQGFKQKMASRHTVKALVASLLIAFSPHAVLPVHAQPQLPALGDGGDMTASAERRLGDSIIRHLYRDPDYIDDPVLVEYVQTLWQALLAAARERGELSPELDERFAWEVLLGRDRTVNAFALPGGYLGVHLGLIGVVASRDELASVLAHELSHVTQRHIARLITQQNRQTPLMIGAMILGALAASKSPHAAQALAMGGQALVVQNQLNFSRDMEREADRVGYSLMEPAGFAPQGFAAMFEKLQQANRINDNGSWPYLRSHPLTTERLADVQARQLQATPAPPPTLEHALLAARARVLARPGVEVLRQWLAEPEGGGFAALPAARRSAALYAAVLAASELREAAVARALHPRLLQAVQGDAAALRQARLLAAEVELAAGDAASAWRLVPTGEQRPERMLRTQAGLRAGQVGDLAGPLQTWVALHPRDAGMWQLLSSVWQAQGQPLRAVRAEAEAHAARYDYAAAVDRFKAGQDLARQSRSAADHVEASIIDTRLRAVESLLREQAAER
ncbi:MAG TPA: peptidase M48 [Comamonadaceae bacterium]|nr:peptidase M48 [Comamonadaceae bacterium]